MSAIDELRGNGLLIDAANGTPEPEEPIGININAVDNAPSNEPENVDLSDIGKRSKVIRPEIQGGGGRKTVAATDIIPDSKEEEPDIRESLQKDLLDLNNPNSVFSQFMKEEQEEAAKWMVEDQKKKEAEEVANEQEEATEEPSQEQPTYVTGNEGMENYAIKETQVDYGSVEQEDISHLIGEDAHTETAPIMEEAEQNTVAVLPEVEEVVAETAAPKVEKPERFDAPDIEVEVEDSLKQYNIPIEEEDTAQIVSENEDVDDTLKKLQRLATEKLKPVSSRLNISSFTILKKPIVNAKQTIPEKKTRTAKWVVPTQDSVIYMSEFSGAELERLREYSENNRSLDLLNKRYRMIYDHLAGAKPATFEQWIRVTPYEDVDHYFFAVYIASFKGANYLPIDCINTECDETFLTDDIKIMDMVKFENEEAKIKFTNAYQSEQALNSKGIYCTEVVPISENIAVSFREPSIYNIFEIAGLNQETRNKYSAILEYIPYIDSIYMIDYNNQNLVPVTYKMYPDNPNRTMNSKLSTYESIFDMLSVDEFGVIKAYVAKLGEKDPGMYYVFPSVQCKKCGTFTDEIRATAEELVFTRYQLGALVTTQLD